MYEQIRREARRPAKFTVARSGRLPEATAHADERGGTRPDTAPAPAGQACLFCRYRRPAAAGEGAHA